MTTVRFLAASVLILTLHARAAGPSESEALGYQRVVSMLQYLAADYPSAVESGLASELEEQSMFAREVVSSLSERAGAEGLKVEALELQRRIDAHAVPADVTRACEHLEQAVTAHAALRRAPRHLPSLEHGRYLFALSCAACHGIDGRGDTDTARSLEPRPVDLGDRALAPLSPYRVFNVLTFGIPNTPMPSFPSLSEDDRWDLAFHVMTLSRPVCEWRTPPRVPLAEIAHSTDLELSVAHGAPAVPCLRLGVSNVDTEQLIRLTREEVAEAARRVHAGETKAGRRQLLDAYMLDFEPVEARLQRTMPGRVAAIETSFTRAQQRMDGDLAAFDEEILRLQALLGEVTGEVAPVVPAQASGSRPGVAVLCALLGGIALLAWWRFHRSGSRSRPPP